MDQDALLMEEVRNGNTEAFDLLMNRYKKPLLNFIFRMVSDVSVAEELAQDAFVKAYMARQRYKPTAKFSTWLFKIASNTTLKYLRKNSRIIRQCEIDDPADDGTGRFYRMNLEHGANAHELMERKEMANLLRKALNDLPEKERMALSLRKYNEFSYQEISEVMKCSVGAVKTYIHRGKIKLREIMAQRDHNRFPLSASRKVVQNEM